MQQLTLCSNIDCRMTEFCERFSQTPKEGQDFDRYEPDENNRCDEFIAVDSLITLYKGEQFP